MQKITIKLFCIVSITFSTLWSSVIQAGSPVSSINVSTEAEFNSAIAQYSALTSSSDSLTIQLTSNITLNAPLTSINNGSLSRPNLNIISSNASILRTLDGNNAHQILNITGFSRVTIENIRFSNGRDTVGEGRGGAIFIDNDAIVLIRRSEFVNNSAPGEASAMFADSGGAIENEGNLTVFSSTFENNTARSSGGAINTASSSQTTIVTSTFVNNSVTSDISNFGGAVNICSTNCTANVTQSTFSGNTVQDEGFLQGLRNDGGTLTIRGNIFADGCDHSSFGTLTNLGNNVFSVSVFSCTTVASDVVDEDPLLIALSDNGGITRTMAIPESSPARDAGGMVGPINTSDQRGVSRNTLPADSGAYEFVIADRFDQVARNDSAENATQLVNGSFNNLSIDDVATRDVDNYKFNLKAGEEFTAEIMFSNVQADLDLRLLDENETSLVTSLSVSDDEQLSFTPTQDGEFILRVFRFFSSEPGTLFYDLTVSGIDEPSDLCVPIKAKNGSVAVICL